METFSEILARIGRSDKDTCHTYGPWYDLWFADRRESARNVLEVGVCVFGGGGALALAEYFRGATVWAVDVDPSRCCEEIFTHPRIKFLGCDAYDPAFASRLNGTTFDIVIDDASHDAPDQFRLLASLRASLDERGIYVVEDCCTQHWTSRLAAARALGLRQTLVDMSTDATYDNTLIRFDPVPPMGHAGGGLT